RGDALALARVYLCVDLRDFSAARMVAWFAASAAIGRGALYRRALSLRAARDGAIGNRLYLDCARKCAGGGLRGVGFERFGDCDNAAFTAIFAASRYLGAWQKRIAFARDWPHQPAYFTALFARS